MIPNQWYAVLEARKLKNKPLGIDRLGRKLVIWRNAKGQAVIQSDRCAHKGARLSLGLVNDGCIECPYHGLRFDSSGTCKLVPFMDEDYDIPKNWRVEAYSCREAYGLLWMWHGPAEPSKELPWFDTLPQSQAKSWQTSDIWPYHYTRIVDSNFDIYHFPFVHRSINPGLGPVIVEQELNDLGTMIQTRATLDDFKRARKGTAARKTFVMNVRMPSLLYFEMSPRLVLLAIMTPIDMERTWVFARYYAKMPLGGLVAWIVGRFEYKIVQDQDRKIMDSLPKGPVQAGEYIYGKPDAGSILWFKKRKQLIKQVETKRKAASE